MTNLPERADILNQNIITSDWKTYYGNIRDFISQMLGGSEPEVSVVQEESISPTKAVIALDLDELVKESLLKNISIVNYPTSQWLFLLLNNPGKKITIAHGQPGDGAIYTFTQENEQIVSGDVIILKRDGNIWQQVDLMAYARATDDELAEGTSKFKSPTVAQLKPYLSNATSSAMGVIVYALRNPEGTLKCDTTEYQLNTFPQLAEYLQSGKIPSTSFSEYNSLTSSQGFCEKFGLDVASGKFKCPNLQTQKIGKTTYFAYVAVYNTVTAESLIELQGILDQCLTVQSAINAKGQEITNYVNNSLAELANKKNEYIQNLKTQEQNSLTSLTSATNTHLGELDDKKDISIAEIEAKTDSFNSNAADKTTAFNNNAASKQALVDASASAAAVSAQEAANSAVAARPLSDKNITNCITAIPQDIKLELNNRTLTLKAGSRVYDGNGLFKDISSDLTLTPSGYFDIPHVIFVKEDGTLYARALVDCASGTTVPSSGLFLYYNTNDKKVYQVDSGTVIGTVSFPLCVFNVSGGVVTSIDQVFNGMGYIGSTIFALPGVEGLIPNGRNTDGSLNNTKFTTTRVLTKTENSAFSGALGLSASTIQNFITAYYDEKSNLVLNSSGINLGCVLFGTYSRGAGGRITSFSPKNTFQAADRNELPPERVKKIAYENDRYIPCTGAATVVLQETDEILSLGIENNTTITFDRSQLSFPKYWATFQLKFLFPNGAKTVSISPTQLVINGNVPDFSDGKSHWVVIRFAQASTSNMILSDAGTEG